jgi:hypothetical protein
MDSDVRATALMAGLWAMTGSAACGVTASDSATPPESGHESGTDAGRSTGTDAAALDASGFDSWSPPPDASCCPALDEPAFDWNMLYPACDGMGCEVAYWCTGARGVVAIDATFPGCFVYTSVTYCPEGILANWTCDRQLCSGCLFGDIFAGEDFVRLCALVTNGVFTSSWCSKTW